MIEHVWSVLSQSVSVDERSQSLSIFNILEKITICSDINEPIVLPIAHQISSLWVRKDLDVPCNGKMRVFVSKPNEEKQEVLELNVDLSDSPFHRTIVRANQLIITGPGKYVFFVELLNQESQNWDTVSKIPLIVEMKK